MGYEILDAGQARAEPPTSPHGRLEVVDLESLPAPQAGPPRRPPHRWHPSRWTALLVTAAMLLVGIGAGAWVEQRSNRLAQAAAAAKIRVLAVGQPATMTLAGQVTAASVRVSLINLGRVPVEVQTSPPVARPFAGATVVGLASGSARIEPGASQQVVAVVGVMCGTQVPVSPTISVRGPDGQTHQLTVRDENLNTYRVDRRAVCGDPDSALLNSQLLGTVRNPLLMLRNASHHAVAISIDADSPIQAAPPLKGQVQQSQRVGAVGPPVTVTTVPLMPVVLSAEAEITVALQVRVRGCQPLNTLAQQGYLLLTGVPIAVEHTTPENLSSAIDLTALLGAAQQRACG